MRGFGPKDIQVGLGCLIFFTLDKHVPPRITQFQYHITNLHVIDTWRVPALICLLGVYVLAGCATLDNARGIAMLQEYK